MSSAGPATRLLRLPREATVLQHPESGFVLSIAGGTPKMSDENSHGEPDTATKVEHARDHEG
jgi:hypothetical protein